MASNIYGVSQVSEITPYLYLTSVYGATKENIIKKNVSLLINSAQELPKQDIPGVESIKLFLDDTPYALINVYFDRMADKINDHISRGGKALVHCVLGVSRSTSLVLAYLMKYKNMSLKHAFEYVASRRPCVRPNPGFWRQLLDYEKKLLYSQNERAVSTNSHHNHQVHKNETSIPISIVSTASPRQPTYTTSSNTNNNNINIHTYSSPMVSNRSTVAEQRPASSSRYQTSSRSNYNNSNNVNSSNDFSNLNSMNKMSSSFSKLISNSSNFTNANKPIIKNSSYYDYALNPSVTTSAVLTYLSNNQPGPHRTSLILNDDSSKFANPRSSNFSTTYRSSYGKF